jgi:hypothetical protein
MPIAMACKARSDLNGGRFNSKALCKPMTQKGNMAHHCCSKNPMVLLQNVNLLMLIKAK